MTLGKPQPGSKEGPPLERVEARKYAKLAEEELRGLAEFWAMARERGAQLLGIEAVATGTVVALKGLPRGRPTETHVHVATGQPMGPWLEALLGAFERAEGNVPPDPAEQETEPPPEEVQREAPLDSAPGSLTEEEERMRQFLVKMGFLAPQAAPAAPKPIPDGGSIKTQTNAEGPVQFRQHTSNIKTQSGRPQHRHQAGALPPGAAGMCSNCEVQPVMHPGSKFCGSKCAQEYHMNVLAKRQGVNLPRIK